MGLSRVLRDGDAEMQLFGNYTLVCKLSDIFRNKISIKTYLCPDSVSHENRSGGFNHAISNQERNSENRCHSASPKGTHRHPGQSRGFGNGGLFVGQVSI